MSRTSIISFCCCSKNNHTWQNIPNWAKVSLRILFQNSLSLVKIHHFLASRFLQNTNPKSLLCMFVEKIHVLLIVIRQSDGDIKHGSFLVLFVKRMLMPAPGFSFTHPHFICITQTLHTTMHSSLLSPPIYKYHPAIWSTEVVQSR